MTTKTKYLVIALLLLVLVTTSVGLSTWNIHYQAVIGDIAYDTSTKSSILNNYVYFGATDDANRAQANIQQNGSALYTYPIGYNTNSDGSVVFDGENYSTKTDDLFTYTYESGKEYSPSVFVPSKTAIKGDLNHPANLFLDESALDIGWGIEDVFKEIEWEYQYRLASVPFDTSYLEEDYKGNSDNYCEVNAVYYAENQITVYLSWKNGKGNHQGDGIRVDFVVDENGNESFTIRDKNNNELTAQKAKLELDSTTDYVAIGVKGFRTYKFERKNCGWTTDIPKDTGVWECRITAKAANEEAYEEIINKDAKDRTDDEKILVETIDLLNSNTENDVDYATQVTYAVMPAPVSKQNTVTDYNGGTEKLQAKRSGTTRGTMPLAEESQQTQEAAEKYVFTLGTGDAAISGTSFVYKGQGYNIEIEADFQPTEGATAISINYAEEQEKDAKDLYSHEGITSIDDHVYSTYGFSSDPNYIVSDPAVYYTIIKQEVKLTGWSGLETIYNGEAQVVTPTLVNDHGEVKAKIEYSYNGDTSTTHTNAGIYTVKAELDDAVEGSGHSSNFFLVNHASNGNSTEKTDLTATFTINKAPLTVTANNHEITYGDAFAHNGVTYGVKDGQEIKNGFIGTDNATNSLAGTLSIVSTTKGEIPGYDQSAAETRKVGNYTLIASGYEDKDESGKPIYADDGKHNYTFTYVDGILTVKQLVAKFDWSNLDPTYNGTAQKPVATVTNKQYDDDVSILVTGEQTNANVQVDESGNLVQDSNGYSLTATYTATASSLAGAQAGNYTLEASGLTQDFVIKPMSISGATITLGTALTYNGKEQTRDFTTEITLAESTATLAESTDYLVAGHKATNAFTYTLTITGQGNYYQTKTSDWEILKKDLTVTAKDVAVIYGDEITYTATYDGFVAGEGVGNLAGEIAYNSGYVRYQNISNWDSTGNKGVYTIVASGYDNTSANDGKHNYNISYEDGTLTVEKATITNISVVGYTGTYDGAQHYFSATATTVYSRPITVTFYKGENDQGNVVTFVKDVADSGKYFCKITAPNHYDATSTFTVSITPKPVAQPTADNREFVYNGTEQTYELATNDDYTIANNKQTNANSYKVIVSLKDKDNFIWQANNNTDDLSFTFTISPASVKVVVADQEITYGEDAPTYTVTYTGLFGSDSLGTTASCDYTKGNDAGTYEITLSENTNGNYVISNDSKTTATLTVKKAPNSITSISIVGWTYGQTAKDPSATAQFGDTITFTYSADGTNFSNEVPTNAGTYTLKATVAETTNYESAEATTTFTIAKAEVTSPAENTTKFEYTTQEQTYALTESDLYTINNNKRTIAGSQTVTVSLNDKGNYQWDNGTSDDLTFTFTIAKATVGTPEIQSKEYNGNLQTADVPVRSYYTVIENNGGTNIGTYNVKLRLVDSANTQWESTTNADITLSFSITKITTIISDLVLDGWTYGEQANSPTATINHNTAIAYTYSKDGVTYTSTVPSEPGTYYVKASVDETENYTAAEETKTFEISRIVVTKPAEDKKYVYDGTTKTYSLQTSTLYTITSDGLTQTNAGTYPITITLNDTVHYQWDDYSDTALVYNFVIEKASIASATITLSNNVNLVYTEEEQTVTVRMVVLNGKELTTNDYTVSGTSGTNAGTYTVTVTGQGNYTDTATTTFTIAKLTISRPEANSTRFVYNGTEQVYSLSSIDEYTITGNKQTNAGEYKVVVELKDKLNCQWDNETTENLEYDFIIEKATITKPSADETKFSYTGTEQTYTIVENAAYTITGNKQTNAGEHFVTVAFVSSNYQWNDGTTEAITFTFSIAKVKLTITAKDVTVDYGDPVPTYTVTYDGFVNGEDQSVLTGTLVFDCTYAQGTKVGTYCPIKASGLTSNNYNITYVNGSVTIKQLVISLDETLLEYKYGDTGATEIITNAQNNVNISYGSIGNVISITYTDGITTSSNSTISVGNTYRIDYKLLDTTNYTWATTKENTCSCYYKYKTALLNGEYYTIEDAIVETNTTAGHIVLAKGSSSFTGLTSYYEGNGEFTLASGSSIFVPHKDGASYLGSNTSGKVFDVGEDKTEELYSILTIPTGIHLTVEGSLGIGGYILSGGIVTRRGVIMNEGTISVDGNLHSIGFLKSATGQGQVYVNGGATALDVFVAYDYKGGRNTLGICNMDDTTLFPFNAYSLHNISCTTYIYKDATYITKFYVDASVMELTKEITVIGENGLFEITSDGGYIKKYATNPDKAWETDHDKNVVGLTTAEGSNQIAGQKDIIIICGSVTDNSIQIKEGSGSYKVDITTGPDYPLPIAYMDIYVGDEETDTNGNLVLDAVSYNFLPGTKLEITQNGTMTVASNIKMYFYTTKQCDLDFITNFSYIYSGSPNYTNYRFPTYCVDYDDAVLEVNNSATINGSIAGTITTNSDNGIVTIGNTNVSVVYLTYLNYKGGLTMKSPANSNASTRVAEGKIVDNALGTSSSQSTFDTGTYKSIGNVWYKTGNSTIKYIMNDGSGTISEQSFENGTSAVLLNPSRTGYTFSAWLDSNNNIYRGSSSVKLYGDISLTAQWELNKYLVTILDENGTPLNQTEIYYGSVYGDTLPALTKDGYLLKWKIVGTDTFVTEDTPLSLAQDHTIQAEWEKQGTLVEIQFISNGSTISTQMLNAGSTFTTLPTTTRNGYNFIGWFTEDGDGGTQINLGSTIPEVSSKYYAHWDPIIYTITFDANGGECSKASETGSIEQSITLPTPTRTGYAFNGWYTASSGGNKVGDAGTSYTPNSHIVLYAQWAAATYKVTYNANGGSCTTSEESVVYPNKVTLPTPTRDGYTFNGWYTASSGGTKVGDAGATYTPEANITLYAQWSEQSSGGCLAAGTLITMADGTVKKVEDVTTDDYLLVFNHETGKYEASKVLFIDYDGWQVWEVVYLVFDNGTTSRIIYEHGFFDRTLNKYVYIDKFNMSQFIGHEFATAEIDGTTQGTGTTRLVNAYVVEEYTGCYSPTTVYHLNLIADGLLSMPGGIEGMFNFFDYDPATLAYDQQAMQQDIATYGLMTYEDFAEYMSYEVYCCFPAQYIGISLGKGLMTEEYLQYLIERYIVGMGLEDSVAQPQTTTTDVAEATLPPQVVTGDEQQQDIVEESIE